MLKIEGLFRYWRIITFWSVLRCFIFPTFLRPFENIRADIISVIMRVKKKNEEKNPVENSNIMYFRSRCFMYFFVLDDFETSNLESFNMYFYKGGSKESQNKNIMYVRSRLKKKLVNFETSNNVTEPQVLYVHREDILNYSNIAVSMDTTQLKYHFLASPYWVCKIRVHIWHWFSDTFLVMTQNL